MAIPELNDKASAILEAWFPGTEGAAAVGDVLLGDLFPSGRLTMSFPYAVGQCPLYYNCYNTGRPAKDVYVSARFSSRYIDGPSVSLYPFGYGLTYTQFEYGEISLSQDRMGRDEKVIASCTLKNVGIRKGTETVQLYLPDMFGSRVRPVNISSLTRILLPYQEG